MELIRCESQSLERLAFSWFAAQMLSNIPAPAATGWRLSRQTLTQDG